MPRVPKPRVEGERKIPLRHCREATLKRITGDEPPIGELKVERKKVQPKEEISKYPDNRKSHPPYFHMIKRAIKTDKTRKGTTRQAIEKYIFSNYSMSGNWRPHYALALKKLCAQGRLISPYPMRFKLSPKEVKKIKKKQKKTVSKKSKSLSKEKTTRSKLPSKATKSKKLPSKEKTTKSKKTNVKDKPKKSIRENSITKKTPARSRNPSLVAKTVKPTTRAGIAKKPIVRGVAKKHEKETESSKNTELIWVWQYYDNGFHNYQTDANDVVESVYQEYLKSPFTCDVRAVKSGQWMYEIDFRVMTQKNIRHESHTERKIRRYQIPASEQTNYDKNYGGSDKSDKS